MSPDKQESHKVSEADAFAFSTAIDHKLQLVSEKDLGVAQGKFGKFIVNTNIIYPLLSDCPRALEMFPELVEQALVNIGSGQNYEGKKVITVEIDMIPVRSSLSRSVLSYVFTWLEGSAPGYFISESIPDDDKLDETGEPIVEPHILLHGGFSRGHLNKLKSFVENLGNVHPA